MLLGSLLHKKIIIMIFNMPKSPFATPVERFLVQNQHVRRLCIGFWSKIINYHEKVTVCDACRAHMCFCRVEAAKSPERRSSFKTKTSQSHRLRRLSSAFFVPDQYVRRLCVGFWSKIMHFHEKVTVCDACRALLGHARAVTSSAP